MMKKPVNRKSRVIYSEIYESYIVIYYNPDSGNHCIEPGFETQVDAENFAAKKDELAEYPILFGCI